MPKQDWNQIITFFKTKDGTYLENFLNFDEVFCPSNKHENIFDKTHNAFSAKLLEKPNPANWINQIKKYIIESKGAKK